MLFHEPTRQSLGIKLKGNIVIVDEAHNILEAINGMYSALLTGKQLMEALAQTQLYFERYETRLKEKNAAYVKKAIAAMEAIVQYLHSQLRPSAMEEPSTPTVHGSEASAASMTVKSPPQVSIGISGTAGKELRGGGVEEQRLIRVNEFLFEANIADVNFFKLNQFIDRSGIVRKLHGFVAAARERLVEMEAKTTVTTLQSESSSPPDDEDVDPLGENVSKHRPSLGFVEAFFKALTNPASDGRVLVTLRGGESAHTH